MSDQTELPGMEMQPQNTHVFGYYGAGLTESETRQAIAEIEELAPITGARRTIKQLCISLAISIDKGNAKGRAIANEASQLFLMMQQLAPPESNIPDDSAFTPELKRLLDVFAAPARFDAAPASDSPEL